MFSVPEDEYDSFNDGADLDLLTQVTTPKENSSETAGVTEKPTVQTLEEEPVTDHTPEELCSGKAFDAFTNLKNGSIFAFRGMKTRYIYWNKGGKQGKSIFSQTASCRRNFWGWTNVAFLKENLSQSLVTMVKLS